MTPDARQQQTKGRVAQASVDLANGSVVGIE